MKLANNSLFTFLRKHAFSMGVFGILFGFFFFAGGLVVANGQTMGPNDSHVVSLYVDGQETVAPTRAATVGEFISKAHITLAESDLVEPSIKTEINSDNFRIQVYHARPVTIIDGTNIKHVLSPHKSAKLIAEKAGIAVYPEDKLTTTTTSNFVQENILGEKLIIDRATPVTVSLYGATPILYRTHSKTVGSFFKERGITPESGATVTPSLNAPIATNLPIFVSKMGKTVINTEETVAFPVESTPDPTQPLGSINIITPGVLGKKQMVYEVELRDGKEVGRRVLQEVVTVQPQKQVQTKGTKAPDMSGDRVSWMRAAGISEADFYAADFVIGHESGWRPGATSGSGCTGLGQACPGRKLAAACPNWQVDPVCQLRFFSGYANRYGGWQGAYNAWLRQHWW